LVPRLDRNERDFAVDKSYHAASQCSGGHQTMNAIANAIPATLLAAVLLGGLAGCAPNYSPDTYDSRAVQQANKVEQGVLVGVRPVGVRADATVGTVTGSAAGGIVGSQTGSGVASAFGALGGAVVGGLAGSAVAHSIGDVAAFEYIVRKGNGDLLSVTQQDKAPLRLGQKVLVIAGIQARVVPDYTMALAAPPPPPPPPTPVETAPHPDAVTVEPLPPPAPAVPVAGPASPAAALAIAPTSAPVLTPAGASLVPAP